jgi:hypothetical protein
LHIGQFHETSLVEVRQASTLRQSGGKLASKANELRVEQLVIRRRPVSGKRTLANEENLGS